MGEGAQGLEPRSAAFPGPKWKTGLALEQSGCVGHELVPTWDAGAGRGGLA